MATSLHRDDSRASMTTGNGTKLSILSSDITATPADYVVRFVDKNLTSRDGLSKAIAETAGWESVKKECDDYTSKKGPLPASQVFVSTGGKRWKGILHVCLSVTPDKDELTESTLNCLKNAHGLLKGRTVEAQNQPFNTIAFPNVTSVSAEISGQSFLAAVLKFDYEFAGDTILNHIMFYDDDKDRVAQLRIKFKKSSQMQDEPLRIVMVGKTGMGKSHTGNSILRNDFFLVERNLRSVTHRSSFATVTRNGCDIELVDTPGVFDTENPDLKTSQEIELAKSVLYTLPGPHIFIAVFRSDVRFTEEDAKVLAKMEEVFSSDIRRFLIVVFTHTDEQKVLDELLLNVPDAVKDLLDRCQRRVLAIDNGKPGKRPPECDVQVDVIIELAKKLREDNRKAHEVNPKLTEYYTHDILNRCLQMISSSDTTKTLAEIKKDILNDATGGVAPKLVHEATEAARPWYKLCVIL